MMLCYVMWGKGKKLSISSFLSDTSSMQHYVLLADICVENNYHNHSLVYNPQAFSPIQNSMKMTHRCSIQIVPILHCQENAIL